MEFSYETAVQMTDARTTSSLMGGAGLALLGTTCCALPIALVVLGMGGAVASMVSVAPWLVTLSEYKLVTFTATGLVSIPDTLIAFDGDGESALESTAAIILPTVRVLNEAGDPYQGAQVVFSLTGGGGAITGGTTTTDANGMAKVGSFTLGPAGAYNNRAGLILLLPDKFYLEA